MGWRGSARQGGHQGRRLCQLTWRNLITWQHRIGWWRSQGQHKRSRWRRTARSWAIAYPPDPAMKRSCHLGGISGVDLTVFSDTVFNHSRIRRFARCLSTRLSDEQKATNSAGEMVQDPCSLWWRTQQSTNYEFLFHGQSNSSRRIRNSGFSLNSGKNARNKYEMYQRNLTAKQKSHRMGRRKQWTEKSRETRRPVKLVANRRPDRNMSGQSKGTQAGVRG